MNNNELKQTTQQNTHTHNQRKKSYALACVAPSLQALRAETMVDGLPRAPKLIYDLLY